MDGMGGVFDPIMYQILRFVVLCVWHDPRFSGVACLYFYLYCLAFVLFALARLGDFVKHSVAL